MARNYFALAVERVYAIWRDAISVTETRRSVLLQSRAGVRPCWYNSTCVRPTRDLTNFES
jgi:hypothetical protein